MQSVATSLSSRTWIDPSMCFLYLFVLTIYYEQKCNTWPDGYLKWVGDRARPRPKFWHSSVTWAHIWDFHQDQWWD